MFEQNCIENHPVVVYSIFQSRLIPKIDVLYISLHLSLMKTQFGSVVGFCD